MKITKINEFMKLFTNPCLHPLIKNFATAPNILPALEALSPMK
jgi:hypothetical protein